MYKKGRVNSNSRIISTDEDPSLRIESSAIINLRGVSTKLNKYIYILLRQLVGNMILFIKVVSGLGKIFQSSKLKCTKFSVAICNLLQSSIRKAELTEHYIVSLSLHDCTNGM